MFIIIKALAVAWGMPATSIILHILEMCKMKLAAFLLLAMPETA